MLDERHGMCFDAAIRGGPVTGSAAADPTDSVLIQRTVGSYKVLVRFLLFVNGDRKVSKKLCRPPILGGSR